MSRRVIVIAPHPDDETLGCGGTLLKHIKNQDQVYWLIVTEARAADGFNEENIEKEKKRNYRCSG